MASPKYLLAKQIEDCILRIHSQGFSTMSSDQIKKVSVEDLKAALMHIKEAQSILKIE